MNRDERDQLIDELLEGVISEADFIRLEAEFHADPEARRAYYDRLNLDGLLEAEATIEGGDSAKVVEVDFQKTIFVWRGIAAAAAVIALLAVGISCKRF